MITTVNYHLVKQCNYRCKFCYATFNDFDAPTAGQRRHEAVVEALALSGQFRKINFAGGEPMLLPYLGSLLARAKRNGLETSVITNGSRLSLEWLARQVGQLDILGISLDSDRAETNARIGREQQGRQLDLERLQRIADFCHVNGILLKINTVVNAFNQDELLA